MMKATPIAVICMLLALSLGVSARSLQEEVAPAKWSKYVTAWDIISSDPNLKILKGLIEDNKLVEPLDNPQKPVTVFAPNDDAIAALVATLPPGTDVTNPVIVQILLQHVVNGNKPFSKIGTVFDSLNPGNPITRVKPSKSGYGKWEDKWGKWEDKWSKYNKTVKWDKHDKWGKDDKYNPTDKWDKEDKHDKWGKWSKYNKTEKFDKWDKWSKHNKTEKWDKEDKWSKHNKTEKHVHTASFGFKKQTWTDGQGNTVTVYRVTKAKAGTVYYSEDVLLPNNAFTSVVDAAKYYNYTSILGLIPVDLVPVIEDPTVAKTLFAPSNAAIAVVEPVIKGLNQTTVIDVLKYHVAPGLYTVAWTAQQIATLLGQLLSLVAPNQIANPNGLPAGTPATVLTKNIYYPGGLFQGIDQVLIPKL